MTPITFNPYGINSDAITIIAERITHWYMVEYNGNRGTVVVLDTGKEITVGELPHDVQLMIRKATFRNER